MKRCIQVEVDNLKEYVTIAQENAWHLSEATKEAKDKADEASKSLKHVLRLQREGRLHENDIREFYDKFARVHMLNQLLASYAVSDVAMVMDDARTTLESILPKLENM